MTCAKAVQLQLVARAQARIQKQQLEPTAKERLCLVSAQRPELVAAALAVNRAAEPCRRKAAILPCLSPRKLSSKALRLLRTTSKAAESYRVREDESCVAQERAVRRGVPVI